MELTLDIDLEELTKAILVDLHTCETLALNLSLLPHDEIMLLIKLIAEYIDEGDFVKKIHDMCVEEIEKYEEHTT